MLTNDKSILVVLTPGRIQATLIRGNSVVATSSRELPPAKWIDTWEQGLFGFDEPLSSLLKEVRGGTCDVHVLYHGKEASVDVPTLQMPSVDALAAAELALRAENAGTRQGICRALWSTTVPPHRTHVLVASDRNETISSLAAWVRRAGGRPGRALPLSVVQIARVAGATCSDTTTTPTCRIMMGDVSTVLAGGTSGQMSFVRSVDLGMSLLTDVLVQATADADPRFTPSTAREYLQRVGLPSRNGAGEGAIRVERAMPLLYPVLQRFVVEIRQTLRFGFGVDQSHAQVLLGGLGGNIAGLAEALSTQLECDVIRSEGDEDIDPIFAIEYLRANGFIAEHERDERRSRSLTGAIVGGLLLAGVALGGEFAWLHTQHEAAKARADEQAPEIANATKELQVRREAATLAVNLRCLNEAITAAERSKVDMYAVMSEVTRVAPPNVRIEEMSVTVSDEYTLLGLRGSATWIDKAETDPLSTFLESLRQCSLVDAVELGSTHVLETAAGKSKEFALNARLKRVVLSASGEKP